MGDAPKQFVYVLRPTPLLREEENWSERDHKAAEAHREYIEGLTENGTLILAGRTVPLDTRTFGLVIFEAASEEAARAIMANDPGITRGIMTGELHAYRVAVQRKA